MKRENPAVLFCEDQIRKQKEYCEANAIYPSWPEVADRLLERRDELKDAYKDIFCSLNGNAILGNVFFDAVLCATVVWRPDRIQKMRDDKKLLEGINGNIAKAADLLADLLNERSELENRNSFGFDNHFSVLDVIDCASRDNGHYQAWVGEELKRLDTRFDQKYWPTIAEFVEEIGNDASGSPSRVDIYDDVTRSAIESRKGSKSDFARALLKRVEICKGTQAAGLPRSFELKNESWASLMNVLLNLEPEEIVDGSYIKRLRQRTVEIGSAH